MRIIAATVVCLAAALIFAFPAGSNAGELVPRNPIEGGKTDHSLEHGQQDDQSR